MARNLFRIQKAILLFLLTLAVLGSGCIFSPDGEPPQDDDSRKPERDSIDGARDLYEFTWKEKLLTDYSDLLHVGYEFYPRDEDVADFPWLQGASWERTDELEIASNMFDSNFQDTPEAEAVDTITIDMIEQSRRLLDAGTNRWEMTCVQQGQVLFSVGNGFSFDTRVVLEFVPDPDEPNLWQIIRQTEIART